MKSNKIIIKGDPKYIDYMYNHLRKEHHSTRDRMTKTNGVKKMKTSNIIEENLEIKKKKKRVRKPNLWNQYIGNTPIKVRKMKFQKLKDII